MNELLARYTDMPIHIAENDMVVESDHIYLIPPRTNLSIFHSKLYLQPYESKHKLNLPIDHFFRSLALDQGENAVAVVLSGTGSDGTLGIRSIKEAGGLVVVQDENTAKFDGMPRSSIATGLVDYILSPDKMAQAIIDYIDHPLAKAPASGGALFTEDMDLLTRITLVLRDYTGIDFSYYKENTIIRRLERRITINRLSNLGSYIGFLQESDKEKDNLYRELLIGVTSFFRDMDAFKTLTEKVLPHLSYEKKTLRIWSIACSTGEEVYSLAILLTDYMEANGINCELKIFATDIDKYALETAGAGYYSDSLVADVNPALLKKYFDKREGGYQISEKIRKKIVFAQHNIIKDPPFSRLDLVVCRNLFIYLKPDMQQRILSKLYFSLQEKGYLFMGSSETIGEMIKAFETIDVKWKIYQAKAGYQSPIFREISFMTQSEQTKNSYLTAGKSPVKSIHMETMLLESMSLVLPPSVIIDDKDQIIQVINNVNQFFTIQQGRFTNNLFSNISKELGLFVNNILRRLKNGEKEVIFEQIKGIQGFEDNALAISGRKLTINDYSYYLIGFEAAPPEDIPKSKESNIVLGTEVNERIKQLELDLQMTKESLQATVEELETSNEELQSSNEELIASNEELQSTNEELQSVNEELYTVNNEYQIKIDELTAANSDLNNLLKNIAVGALYLDRKMCIRKITPLVTKITNILPTDVGRPISHISIFNNYANILEDIEEVVLNLQPKEKEFIDPDNTTWLISIRPYRTDFNAVDGIIATFVDISRLKEEIKKSILANERLDHIMNIAQIAWWEWDIKSGRVTYNPLKATMLGYSMEEFPDNVYEICNLIHPDDYNKTMEIMTEHLQGKREIWDTTYRIRCKDGSYKIYHDQGKVSKWDMNGAPIYAKGSVLNISETE